MSTDIAVVLLLLLMAGSCSAGTNFRLSSAQMLATEGFPVTLECRFSRKIDDRYLIWGYVPPRTNSMQKLLYWSPGSQEPIFLSGGPHRYVASKNFRRSVMSLRISNATARDATRYFCQVSNHLWDINATDWCGCGVSLAVKPVRAPRVRLLTPFEGEKVWATRATLTCEAEGFYPGEISYQWMVNWKSHSVTPEHGEPARKSDGTYISNSRIHIPFPQWDQVRNVHCIVTHVSSTLPLIRTVSRSEVLPPQSPSSFLLPPPRTPPTDGRSVSLTCGATGFYPGTISLSWEVDGEPVGSGVWDTGPVLTPNGTYLTISTLNTPRWLWSSGARYTCQIAHQTQGEPIRKHISLSDLDPVESVSCPTPNVPSTTLPPTETFTTPVVLPPQSPSSFLLPPPRTPPTDGRSVSLTCGATGFYPGTISLSWEVDGEPVGSGVWDTGPVLTPNGTYLTISRLNTPHSLWSSGARYTCQIAHQTQGEPIRKHISLSDLDPVWTVTCPTPHNPSATPPMETLTTPADIDPLTKFLGELAWYWIAAGIGGLVLYTGIVLCISHGVWTCRQRKRSSFSHLGSGTDSCWANSEIPMEKVGADGRKG
ncbi:immunoglobulin gamma-1 heavy chain-like, partial [Pristis pectinata]|uniref:immunoglobulin gamma-1 heavy chain-like n=1 Tax=Pristis pectinata TaxID=685728 RepID=UPI00223DC184